MNITKDIESLSLVVQWDAVEDFIDTTYTLLWSDRTDPTQGVVPLTEQTSYTITGLTFDTVYTISILAANMCGNGPEFTTSILFAADNTSTISSISPTVTASTSTKIAHPSTSSSTKVTSYYVPSTTTTSTEDTTSSFKRYILLLPLLHLLPTLPKLFLLLKLLLLLVLMYITQTQTQTQTHTHYYNYSTAQL